MQAGGQVAGVIVVGTLWLLALRRGFSRVFQSRGVDKYYSCTSVQQPSPCLSLQAAERAARARVWAAAAMGLTGASRPLLAAAQVVGMRWSSTSRDFWKLEGTWALAWYRLVQTELASSVEFTALVSCSSRFDCASRRKLQLKLRWLRRFQVKGMAKFQALGLQAGPVACRRSMFCGRREFPSGKQCRQQAGRWR